MRVHLSGLPVEVGPDGRLSSDQRRALDRITCAPLLPDGVDRVLPDAAAIRLAAEPPWVGSRGIASPGEPPAVTCDGGRVRIGSQDFRAVVNPAEGTADLFDDSGVGHSVETTMRVLLSCRLPHLGGLPLHAAAIAMGAVGAAFYGVSGAGKSTLSACSPFPVLSDEAVVAMPYDGRWEVSSSGFWGTLDRPTAPRGFVRLGGLFALTKDSETRIERFSARRAYVSLLPVITIPDNPALWSAALEALHHLVASVPVYSFGWTPSRSPWDAIREAIGVLSPR